MQDRNISSSWDEDFPDDERLTDRMAAESKPNENGENAPKEEKDEPALVVEDKSGDVNPASDVVSGANTAQTPQASNSLIAEKATDSMQTDSKKETMAKEADDSQGDTKKLFKMWSHKSVEGLDSPSTEDVKPASDVASGAVTAQTPQKSNSSVAEKMTEPMKTDSKKETTAKEAGNSQGDTKNLFKMWSNKSVKGLDSSSTHVSSTRPPPGVPRRARSSITAPPAKEEPSPTATGATPPKPGSLDVVNGLEAHLGEELQQLLKDINRCGEKGAPNVKFGELFDDPEVEQYYEALVGTLKNAKKRGLISFEGQMLLKGPHDKVVVSIVKP